MFEWRLNTFCIFEVNSDIGENYNTDISAILVHLLKGKLQKCPRMFLLMQRSDRLTISFHFEKQTKNHFWTLNLKAEDEPQAELQEDKQFQINVNNEPERNVRHLKNTKGRCLATKNIFVFFSV